MNKTFTIKKYSRRGLISFTTGTIKELTDYFGYTLDCGHSLNCKIPLEPKTIKSLVKALNDSVEETQGSCYYQDYYEDWTGKKIEELKSSISKV